MKRFYLPVLVLIFFGLLASCAYPPDRYNTQRGALIGAGAGALLGQAIGHSTEGTLLGLAAGTVFGGLVGNAVDQDYQAARDAAVYDKPVVYYDRRGHAVEAIPEGVKDNCRTVRKRIWEHGELVKETEEEICDNAPVVTYAPPPPPPAVYYGPGYPNFSFYFGRPYRYHPYPYWHRW